MCLSTLLFWRTPSWGSWTDCCTPMSPLPDIDITDAIEACFQEMIQGKS